MKKIREVWDNLEENLLLTMLLILVVVIFLQVVMRYVARSSLSWSEELGRYLFIWMTWLSTSYAARHNRHLRIEVITDFLSERGKIILNIAAMIVWCGFGIFLINKGCEITAMLWRRGQITAALEIPMALNYAAIPVGAALMSIRLIDEIVRSF
ncbi:TRAP transporter small permease, partial [Synergistaceae bacterium OttesenSCG-928-I11]|nr:TRAP transporter small permease [Synergistaceae bacterium OttesenSCG-928-I11]